MSDNSQDSEAKMRVLLSESEWSAVGVLLISLSDSLRRALLKDPTLRQFEIAQLANLCPNDAEEAKALIPRYGSSSYG